MRNNCHHKYLDSLIDKRSNNLLKCLQICTKISTLAAPNEGFPQPLSCLEQSLTYRCYSFNLSTAAITLAYAR
jgi:hypothetical protein